MSLPPIPSLIEIAREAGAIAQTLRDAGLEVQKKEGGSPVSNADLAVDAFLQAELQKLAPNFGWLSEETTDNPARLSQKRLFVVDPIDGTRAYVKGKSAWSVCIAVVEEGLPVQAVIFVPDTNELYEATSGAGARLNDVVIGPSAVAGLEGLRMLGDGPMFQHPSWPMPWPSMQIETRNSIAYRMCLVACGAHDAAVALSPKNEWDLAAADLILREAGAKSTDHLGRPFRFNRPKPLLRSLVCAGPDVHPLLLQRCEHLKNLGAHAD